MRGSIQRPDDAGGDAGETDEDEGLASAAESESLGVFLLARVWEGRLEDEDDVD